VSEDTLASAAWSTNTAWSHDVDEVLGTHRRVDAALGLAAIAGRFAGGDLASIIDHLAAEREIGEVVIADEARSAQPGTASWARLGGREAGR
jgi:predicted butyrate kinase (DUF1464 family)